MDSDAYLVPEADGVRIVDTHTHELLQRVPGEFLYHLSCLVDHSHLVNPQRKTFLVSIVNFTKQECQYI